MRLHKSDSMLKSIALLTGVAVGAVFAALFAPKSGKETRDDLAKLINDTIDSSKEEAVEIKENVVPNLRAHVKEVADHLTGSAEEAIDTTKTTLKQTGPQSRQLPAES